MKLQQKEIESVLSLDSIGRYRYFIKRIADTQVMYTLQNINREFATSELEGNYLIPFWSAEEFIEPCKTAIWQNYSTVAIDLSINNNALICDFDIYEKKLLNIFPLKNRTGFVVTIEEFIQDLSLELRKYE